MIEDTPSKEFYGVYTDKRGTIHRTDLSSLRSLGEKIAGEVVDCFNRFCGKYGSISQYYTISLVLRRMGKLCSAEPIDFHDPKKVLDLIFRLRMDWYTNKEMRRHLVYRNTTWNTFVAFEKMCIRERVFPNIRLLPGNPKLSSNRILRSTSKPNCGSDFFDALLASISQAETDDKYLEKAAGLMREAGTSFLSCAEREIEITRQYFEAGCRLAESVDYDALKAKIALSIQRGEPYMERLPGSRHLVGMFSSWHPDGKVNALARIFNEHDRLYLGRNRTGIPLTEDPALNGITFSRELARYVGHLTSRIAIPFIVYLLIKNPSFRVQGLLDADLEGDHGEDRILCATGENGDKMRMTIAKPRAGKQTSEVQDAESVAVIQLLILMTEPYRKLLKFTGSAHYNKLFLVVDGGDSFGEPRWIRPKSVRRVFGQDVKRLADPALAENGRRVALKSFLASHEELRRYAQTVTLRDLPVIAGLVTWFDKRGDIGAIARTLGNKPRTAEIHYVPQKWQEIMNTRMIRRCQTFLVLLATDGEAFMLDATHFATAEEVHFFLRQILIDGIIPDEWKRASNSTARCDVEMADGCQLKISISELNLAVLFLYARHIDESHVALARLNLRDGHTETTPYFWLELSRILHLVLANTRARRELAGIYARAVEMTDRLYRKVSFPVLDQ